MWHSWGKNPHGGYFNRPDQIDGDNNGMQALSDLLEGIYMWPDYPRRTPALNFSLKESGKSRADLWALAAMTAVEFGIAKTNMMCENITSEYTMGGCSQRDDEEDCQIEMERAFVFKTGRKDCTFEPAAEDRPYWHDEDEVHPNPHGSGRITADFFTEHFNLNSRETVAHTFGRTRSPTSLFRFGWTSHNMPLFNNRYYRNLINEDSWFIPSNQDCKKLGDAFGKWTKTKFMIEANRDSVGGGPIQFLRFQDACPNCENPDGPNYGGSECCDPANIPEGLQCSPECQKYQAVDGAVETMLNCDMGLYQGFQVEDDWRPVGCAGLERFNYTMWSKRFIIPNDKNEITHFENKSLCFRVSLDDNPVHVILDICEKDPTIFERCNYNEATGKITLENENLSGWNLCALLPYNAENPVMVVNNREDDGCDWYYDQFLGVIQSKTNPEWCIG